MPLLDSFRVDHTIMPAPAVRLAKKMNTSNGDPVYVFDLRFCKPNKEILSQDGMHTLEHLFAGFMRENLKPIDDKVEVIDISPMGCRTGFYMSIIGSPSEEIVREAWKSSMQNVIDSKKIPEANIYQCGCAKMHSLPKAQDIAKDTLNKGISIMNNEELYLSEEKLIELGNEL